MTINPKIESFQKLEATDAELFVQNHLDRFKSWLMWSAPGGLAHINLAANDASYDQFIPPEIASLMGRISAPFDFTFLNAGNGQCVCLVDAIQLIELMEAANG